MDPNEALQRARAVAAAILDNPLDDSTDHPGELAEHFQALDEWLSKGGFAPDAGRSYTPERDA